MQANVDNNLINTSRTRLKNHPPPAPQIIASLSPPSPSSSSSSLVLRPQPLPLHHHHHQFPSRLDAAAPAPDIDISPTARIILDILARAPPHDLESALSSANILPSLSPAIIEQVLKLSYDSPSSAVKFFRWSASSSKHSTYTWNLMVDLLGNNQLFELMWDAIRSMKEQRLLSPATFVSVFDSYCIASRFNEAIMSFDVMDRYGVQPDVVAVNSLLSAICRHHNNQTSTALEFFDRIKAKIPPNGDSFAILLEGWEKEGNLAKAKTTFGEMVVRVGWSPQNMSAYDAFLTTLVRGSQVTEALKFLQVMKGNNCLPGLKFFSNALDILVKHNDSSHAVPLWDIMVGSGLVPDLIMYNAMIGLLCNNNDFDNAFWLLDEMIFDGSFPNSLSYNLIFQCLIKNKKVREAGKFFIEMIKNEWPPTHSNCAGAIAMLLDGEDPEMAIEIWNFMVDSDIEPIDESANALLLGFCNLGRLSELRRFIEDMLDRRINIYESTMTKLKNPFFKEGRKARDTYDSLLRRWKAH